MAQPHSGNGKSNDKAEMAEARALEATTNDKAMAEALAGGKASTKIVLSDDDFRSIQIAEEEMNATKQRLGNLRAQYAAQESVLLKAIEKAEQDYESMVRTMGKKNGVPFKDGAPPVHFNANTKTYTIKS